MLASEAVITVYLHLGSRGDLVTQLQRRLHNLSAQMMPFKLYDPGPVDGVYGPETEAAVRALQLYAGIADDGICGPATLAVLASAEQRWVNSITGTPSVFGVDYASIDGNKPPDWKATATAASFAIIRGAWGTYIDPCLARDRDDAARAGLAVGSYLILRHPELGKPVPPVVDQCNAFIKAYGDRRHGELPPALDVEYERGRAATGLDVRQAIARVEAAVGIMQARYGVVMVYTSARVWAEDHDNLTSSVRACPLWQKVGYRWNAGNDPHLDSDHEEPLPAPWRDSTAAPLAIRQFQGDARRFPGFTATVDVNRFVPHGPCADVRAFALATSA